MIRTFCISIFLILWAQFAVSEPNIGTSEQDLALKENWIKDVDDHLNNLVQRNEFSGSVLISMNGKSLVSAGYAMANREHDIQNTPMTRFRLGSITKQFTAMTILILAEKEMLKVNESVCIYMKNCPIAWQPITIHHLLTHTSGIPSFTGFPDNLQYERLPTTVGKTIDRFKDKKLEFTPGEKFNYSNSGYVLLGGIIEQITGESFEEVVTRLIFIPLEMNDSGYDHPKTILKSRASGYRQQDNQLFNAIHFEMDTPHAAGALYSTVTDLLKWDNALYGDNLVSRKYRDMMFKPFKDSYAYGWFVSTFLNRQVISHGGGISGFSTYLLRIPEEKICIIILSNYEFSKSKEIGDKLASIVLKDV